MQSCCPLYDIVVMTVQQKEQGDRPGLRNPDVEIPAPAPRSEKQQRQSAVGKKGPGYGQCAETQVQKNLIRLRLATRCRLEGKIRDCERDATPGLRLAVPHASLSVGHSREEQSRIAPIPVTLPLPREMLRQSCPTSPLRSYATQRRGQLTITLGSGSFLDGSE